MRISWFPRVVSWLAAAIVGGVFGVAATIGHSVTWASVPVGLLVAAVACGAILLAVRAFTRDRWSTLAAGLGMIATVLVISGVGPGGSVVVPDTPLGRIWMYVVAGLVLLTVAWPSLARPTNTVSDGNSDE